MPRYVRVLDTAVGTPKVADTLAEWVDVNDLIEVQEGEAGGITNDAPVGAIPVTADGDGNLSGDGNLTFFPDGGPGGDTNLLLLGSEADDEATIGGNGLGCQLFVRAAHGDADHVGGELTLSSGQSEGQNGGALNITAGQDTGGGDGGPIAIASGHATGEGGSGGAGGDITIKCGGGNRSDDDGGDVIIAGGDSLDGDGGSVILQGGNSINGSTQGSVQVYSGNSSQGFEVNNNALNVSDKLKVNGNVGFYGATPVARPNIDLTPTAQEIVDALVLLGLVTQS